MDWAKLNDLFIELPPNNQSTSLGLSTLRAHSILAKVFSGKCLAHCNTQHLLIWSEEFSRLRLSVRPTTTVCTPIVFLKDSFEEQSLFAKALYRFDHSGFFIRIFFLFSYTRNYFSASISRSKYTVLMAQMAYINVQRPSQYAFRTCSSLDVVNQWGFRVTNLVLVLQVS